MSFQPVVCADTFAISLVGNLTCTFSFGNRETLRAAYGTTTYKRKFSYIRGTGLNVDHDNYGFFVIYDPSPGPPADADFPAGVTLGGSFVDEHDQPVVPDLSGGATEAKTAFFSGNITIDRDTYLGGDFQILVEAGFNPGVDR